MGNWNSNRWSEYRRRRVVEDCLAFSVTLLRQLHLTDQTNYSGTYSFPLANDIECKLDFNIKPNYEGGLMLSIEAIQLPESTMIVDQQIGMHQTIIPRGGRRWWLECPIVKGHIAGFPQPCARRCAVLYFDAGLRKFGCRQCLDLTYRTRQKHNKTADKIRKDPEAARARLAKAYEKMQSADEQMKDLRRQGLFKGIGQMPKRGFDRC